MLRKNGTRVVAVVSDGDSIIARYADEVLVWAGSEKVGRVLDAHVFLLGKYLLDILGLEFSRKYQIQSGLNQKIRSWRRVFGA